MIEYKLPENEIPNFEYHFQKGNQLSYDICLIKESEQPTFNIWNKVKARKAIKHYNTCLKLIPNHWQTHWLLAKVHQALAQDKKALYHFDQAVNIELTNPDLPREASITVMDLGNISMAITYSLEAIKRNSNDSGLLCNHAINLMVNGDDDEAINWIKKALDKDPDDVINQNAYTLIQAVITGKRKRPKYNQLR